MNIKIQKIQFQLKSVQETINTLTYMSNDYDLPDSGKEILTFLKGYAKGLRYALDSIGDLEPIKVQTSSIYGEHVVPSKAVYDALNRSEDPVSLFNEIKQDLSEKDKVILDCEDGSGCINT